MRRSSRLWSPRLRSDVLLERLLALHPKLIDLSLDRVERLLAALGNPERRLPPTVHVAGTNGKGSVIAYMRAALEAAGYRVHVYTSPHMVRFHERIRLAGALIEEAALAELLAECERLNDDQPITFFEVTTAAAFLGFARTPADVALLETGLGGRLDASNVVARPALSVITPVSIDHEHFLGDGLAAIAGEKAGILKPGVTAVIGPQEPSAAEVIAAKAIEVGSPLIRHGPDFRAKATAEGMRYSSGAGDMTLPRPALPGGHQIDNAAVAVACLETLEGFAVGADHIAAGLTTVDWPGRLQRLRRGPLADRLPDGWELWLDAGHNPAAGQALAGALADWRDRPLHLIVGMLNTKDPVGFLAPLAALASDAACVSIPGEAATLSAAETLAAAQTAGLTAITTDGVEAALARIVAGEPAAKARVLICGSIYLAGTVLADNG